LSSISLCSGASGTSSALAGQPNLAGLESRAVLDVPGNSSLFQTTLHEMITPLLPPCTSRFQSFQPLRPSGMPRNMQGFVCSLRLFCLSFLMCAQALQPKTQSVCHSFPEPLAPVSCFSHLRCFFLFSTKSPEACDVSHDQNAMCQACDPCDNHPSSYGTCFLPAVHAAVLLYQLLSTQLSGQLG
jgi:hypothetical protein